MHRRRNRSTPRPHWRPAGSCAAGASPSPTAGSSGFDDDLLDPSRASDDLVGEGALLQTLAASRSGRMRDAVATLQTEQDAIIRSPLDGVLVVQGAPGTGKTVVALHRAAYLLYRSPQLLSRGVLVIGPNARFLDYISDVLPALGETNVVTSTMDDLCPGHHGLPAADPDVARLLGDARMARTLASFIEGLQGAGGPDGHAVTWDGEALHIPRAVIDRCTEAARKTREKHNVARTTFQDTLLDELHLARPPGRVGQAGLDRGGARRGDRSRRLVAGGQR